MKINRSTKCSFRFATKAKRAQLRQVLTEYGRVVNFFIKHFWNLPSKEVPTKGQLLKLIVDLPLSDPKEPTWLSARFRKVAAREALDMISAARRRWKDKAKRPTHRFAFEIETGPKRQRGINLGLDSGINALASFNDNR